MRICARPGGYPSVRRNWLQPSASYAYCARFLLRRAVLALQRWLESRQIANDAQSNPVFMQLANFAFERIGEQAHQKCHFFLGTAPVFRTEREQGEIGNAALRARSGDVPH